MAESNVLRSPRITHISWGRMEVEGLGRGKDFKLYPGGVASGTGAKPGLGRCQAFNPGTSSNC